jgi:hypothetical protein
MRWNFKDWGASAVMAGHDHIYERLSVNGLTYFVNGLGGASRYDYGTVLSSSQVRYNSNYGAMLVNADSDSIMFRFINTAGTVVDTYTLGLSNPGGIAAPTNLQGQSVAASQINLSWNDNSGNEDGFEIQRCAGASCTNFVRVTSVGEDVESYSDTISSEGSYRYRVRAFNASVNSSFSNIATVLSTEPSDLFSDNFDDGVIDLFKWTPGLFSRSALFVDPLVAVSEHTGRLNIFPDALAEGNHYNGLKSASAWNLTDSSASVEVVDTADNKAVTIFAVGTDKNNWFAFRAKGGTLYLEQRVAAVTTKTSIAYDRTAARFWRIRHDAATDTIVFETSPDEGTWATAWTIPRPFPINAVRIELSAGTGEIIAVPGVAIFDNVRFGPN